LKCPGAVDGATGDAAAPLDSYGSTTVRNRAAIGKGCPLSDCKCRILGNGQRRPAGDFSVGGQGIAVLVDLPRAVLEDDAAPFALLAHVGDTSGLLAVGVAASSDNPGFSVRPCGEDPPEPLFPLPMPEIIFFALPLELVKTLKYDMIWQRRREV